MTADPTKRALWTQASDTLMQSFPKHRQRLKISNVLSERCVRFCFVLFCFRRLLFDGVIRGPLMRLRFCGNYLLFRRPSQRTEYTHGGNHRG